MIKIKYCEIEEFKKDFTKLSKKFRTLKEDLVRLKTYAIETFHIHKQLNNGIVAITGFCSDNIWMYKVKKFACRALKGTSSKSGIRIIYAFDTEKKTVTFIEMYYKSNKPNENKERIKQYLTHESVLI
jgi:mRNA-degrading endonuclease RelE of RelBE toxin-antitoxin system